MRLSIPNPLAVVSGWRAVVVPMFTCIRSTREAPSFTPAAPVSTPQTFLTGCPKPQFRAGATPTTRLTRTAIPTQIHQVSSRLHITRLPPLVPYVYLLVSLTEPAPSGSTDTTRLCQGRLPPRSTHSRGSGCPQLHRTAVTIRYRRSSTSDRINTRLMAHLLDVMSICPAGRVTTPRGRRNPGRGRSRVCVAWG